MAQTFPHSASTRPFGSSPAVKTPQESHANKRKHTPVSPSPAQSRSCSLRDLDSRRERAHSSLLTAALEEHERVRERARRAHERYQLEQEWQKQQQDSEEQKAIEAAHHERLQCQIAEQQRQIEQSQLLAEQLQQAELSKKQAERERLEALKRQEEEAIQQKQQLNPEPSSYTPKSHSSKHTESTVAQIPQASITLDRSPGETKSGSCYIPIPTESQPAMNENSSSIVSSMHQREAEHQSYLMLHKRLKDIRKSVLDQCKSNKSLKSKVGDWRRQINKNVGQLTEQKGTLPQLRVIKNILLQALTVEQPSVRVHDVIVTRHSSRSEISTSPQTSPNISAVFIYELNIFAKRIISQLVSEASVAPKLADPIGVLAISIFAQKDFRSVSDGNPQGSFIDILLAKFHATCPVLFGISGSEDTISGRGRLGWLKNKDSGSFVAAQKHYDRMSGLGTGFAAISLRDFSKSTVISPLPAEHYWRAISRIVNTEKADITQSHLVVLKSMLETHVNRFVMFFGDAARVAIRNALLLFPHKASDGPAKRAIATLPVLLERDQGYTV